jgi:hypothetical protein
VDRFKISGVPPANDLAVPGDFDLSVSVARSIGYGRP